MEATFRRAVRFSASRPGRFLGHLARNHKKYSFAYKLAKGAYQYRKQSMVKTRSGNGRSVSGARRVKRSKSLSQTRGRSLKRSGSRRRSGMRSGSHKKRHHGVVGSSGGVTISSHGRRFKRYRIKGQKLMAPQHVNSVTSGAIGSILGQQTVGVMRLFFDGTTQLNSVFQQKDMQMLLRNLAMGDYYPAPAPVGDTTTMLLQSINVNIRIRSASNADQKLILYDVCNRHDLEAGSALDPAAAWATGAANEAPSAVTVPPQAAGNEETLPGATPFQSRLFCQYYKVLKTTRVNLAAGAEHIHKLSIKINRAFNAEFVSRTGYFAGKSQWVLAVLEGAVSQSLTAPANVNVAAGEIAYVSECNWRFKGLKMNRTVLTRYNGMPTFIDPTVILEDVDVKSAVINV